MYNKCEFSLDAVICITDAVIIRLRAHRHECESEYLYTGSSKHQLACVLMAAFHIDASSVQVTCEFHSYEQFLCRSFLSKPCKDKFVLIQFIQAMTHI